MGQRLIFLGTPPFAVPSLEALAERYEVVAVVTQPDRPARRGRKLAPSAVKKAALELGLRVLQPESLRNEEAVDQLRELEPRVMVVAAFGQILRPAVLDIPPKGIVNVHPSLLPKYRGASPIAGAVLAGEEETGVTIMLMDEGMDTGPILSQSTIEVAPDDTTGSLEEKLSKLGAGLLAETLHAWLVGEIDPRPQGDTEATYTRPIAKKDAVIDWALPAKDIWFRVRAYNPRPGATTLWKGDLLKVLRAHPYADSKQTAKPGEVIELDEGVGVATGRGVLLLEEVQLAGKREMNVEDFVRGQREFVGDVLGR
jgi:methionyl-tRNA formyltransferase